MQSASESILNPLPIVARSLAGVVAEMPVEIGQVRESHFVADVGYGLVAPLQQPAGMGQTKLTHQIAEILAG